MVKILVVEDELPISRLIAMSLSGAGYGCETACDGNEAIKKYDDFAPDLILLDIMLPEIDGYELLEYLKPFHIPIIMITAKNETEDKVRSLRNGADDYITKPFEIVELLARVEALLRRLGKLENHMVVDDVSIDLSSRTVKRKGAYIQLTHKEYELLVLLVQNKNIALFRDIMFEKVWGYDYVGDTRTLDLHIQRLRKKLEWHDRIKTIRKYGYRLEI